MFCYFTCLMLGFFHIYAVSSHFYVKYNWPIYNSVRPIKFARAALASAVGN